MTRLTALCLIPGLIAVAACNPNRTVGSDREADSAAPQPPPEIVSAEEAAATADLAEVDPLTMRTGEIARIVGDGPHCAFSYTAAGHPVLAWSAGSPDAAAIKLNGRLAELTPLGSLAWGSGAIEARLQTESGEPPPRDGRKVETTLIFRIDAEHMFGFRGYVGCPWEQGD